MIEREVPPGAPEEENEVEVNPLNGWLEALSDT